jgi:hypothetical protein
MRIAEDRCPKDGDRVLRATSGTVSPVRFFAELYYASEGGVVVLDDADDGLKDSEFLQLFKSATDTTKRWVSWKKNSPYLKTLEIPTSFEFKGTVIVISNVPYKTKAAGNSSNAAHLDAVLSRCHHVDLGVNSKRALRLWVNYMVREERILDPLFARAGLHYLAEQGAEEIAQFIENEQDSFRSLTLREAVKICDTYCAVDADPMWADMVKFTLA